MTWGTECAQLALAECEGVCVSRREGRNELEFATTQKADDGTVAGRIVVNRYAIERQERWIDVPRRRGFPTE